MGQQSLDAFGSETTQGLGTVYSFDPDGASCDHCGDAVEERWTNGRGALVCAGCKDWSDG